MQQFSIKKLSLLFLILIVAGLDFAVRAQTIQLQPFLSGLSSPVFITNAKDGSNRLFIVEQGGTIKVVQPGSTAPTVFLNISNKIEGGGEKGLLGLAFHPQFALNRKFYVNYTRNSADANFDSETVIAEYTASAANLNVADAGSERILLTVPQPFPNHKGGMIEFGPDGFLYIGLGDGGSANDPGNRAQNRSLLLGKMLRIGVDAPAGSGEAYTIPADNPFVGANTARCPNGNASVGGVTCQEIWALGLRNPFRWSFDRGGTRQLVAGDVGQGQLEEIDIITRGGNYGWRVYEGTNCTNLDGGLCTPTNYIPPIYEYFNANSPRCSVTGGYVYRGRRGTLPAGTYVFADFCTGEIMIQGSQPRNPTVLIDSPGNTSSFGEDEGGELYAVNLGGTIEKIVNPNAATPINAPADFDGDLRTDVSVFRPSNGAWYVVNSFANNFNAVQFGQTGDRLAPGDYDGDGRTDFAVFRNGAWYVVESGRNQFRAVQFGQAGDVPLPGDYNGDRRADFAVFRPSNGFWYIARPTGTPAQNFDSIQFGAAGDTPVPADYDGDGKTDVAVFRSGAWYVLNSGSGNSFRAVTWGVGGDVPVAGDYDGDGKMDVAVWRSSNGTWYALQSSNNALFARQWGANGDTPVPGDYDGDGKTDPTVVRDAGASKIWYITQSFNPAFFRSVAFGSNTDASVPTSDVP